MMLYEIALFLSAGYLICYGVYCLGNRRKGAGLWAFVLAAAPLFFLVTLVCIS